MGLLPPDFRDLHDRKAIDRELYGVAKLSSRQFVGFTRVIQAETISLTYINSMGIIYLAVIDKATGELQGDLVALDDLPPYYQKVVAKDRAHPEWSKLGEGPWCGLQTLDPDVVKSRDLGLTLDKFHYSARSMIGLWPVAQLDHEGRLIDQSALATKSLFKRRDPRDGEGDSRNKTPPIRLADSTSVHPAVFRSTIDGELYVGLLIRSQSGWDWARSPTDGSLWGDGFWANAVRHHQDGPAGILVQHMKAHGFVAQTPPRFKGLPERELQTLDPEVIKSRNLGLTLPEPWASSKTLGGIWPVAQLDPEGREIDQSALLTSILFKSHEVKAGEIAALITLHRIKLDSHFVHPAVFRSATDNELYVGLLVRKSSGWEWVRHPSTGTPWGDGVWATAVRRHMDGPAGILVRHMEAHGFVAQIPDWAPADPASRDNA